MPSTLQHNIDELEEKINEMQDKVDEVDGTDQDVSE
jgi:prefoldin subunit 5